jgi:CRISPR-associated protein Csd1
MIFQALYGLAQREGLVEDPDYEWKPVAYIIQVGVGGRFLGVKSTKLESPDPTMKKVERAKDFRLPKRLPGRSGKNPPPEFLADNALYVFGVIPEGKAMTAEAAAARARSFRDHVARCASESKDPGIEAVVQFLDRYQAEAEVPGLRRAELAAKPSNDVFAFQFEGDGQALVSDRPAVQAWWRARRQKTAGKGQRVCLVSGECLPTAHAHPKIKNLPGGQASGAAIVSFNSGAFESYGWKANENAPVSNAAAEACAAALNRLLATAPPNPRKPGDTLPRRHLSLAAQKSKSDTVVCYWASDACAERFLDSFSGIFASDPETVAEAYRSIWRGVPAEQPEPADFYALVLSGAQGRAVVRSWIESSLREVSKNLAHHFDDLSIAPVTQPAKGKQLPPSLPLGLLLASVCPLGNSEAPAPLASELFESALTGKPYRVTLLLRSIERTRAEKGNLSSDDALERYEAHRRLDARAALIKAYLNRHRRFHLETTNYEEVLPVLDPMNESPGYLLGQLMALLERAQQLAMDANATVVDRYFSGASASPRAVFVRLLKNSQHHLRKAEDEAAKRGTAFLIKRLIDQIAFRFDPKLNGFPARLNTEQQGLFVLGYHQMRRWLWMSAEDRVEWEARFSTLPTAYRWSRENAV